MKETHFQRLREFLIKLPAGAVPLDMKDKLVNFLADCWHMFSGSTQERMGRYKLARMEEPEWETPVLSFKIERHGATAMGSTRAELQRWDLNIDLREAECYELGYRQLSPRAAPVDVKLIADEIAKLIDSRMQDERLKWSETGRVRILTSKFLSGSKQTVEGRRKRFLKAMEERLAPQGWIRSGSWWDYKH